MGGCCSRQQKGQRITLSDIVRRSTKRKSDEPLPLGMQYPMYVVRVAAFLEMTEAKAHQELKAKNLVTKYRKTDNSIAVFVSHQWCGRCHADPQFRQLSVLQKVFRRAMVGTLHIDVDTMSRVYFKLKASTTKGQLLDAGKWWMWYDFFSVPQPVCAIAESNQHTTDELLVKAVASLASYVAYCQVFLVLAPSVRHDQGFVTDYTTWKSRGWCRLERLARALSSSEDTRMLVVRRSDTVFEMGAIEWLFDPVGEGCFSVESDKERVGEMAKRLVEHRLQFVWETNRLQEYRRLMALRAAMFRGLPVDASKVLPPQQKELPTGDPPECFLKLFQLQNPVDYVEGTSPLMLAACSGDLPAIESFVRAGADARCVEKINRPVFLVFKKQQPLHHVGLHGCIPALTLLLERRASVNARDAKGLTPLHCAAFSGDTAMVGELLERRADLDAKDNISATPLLGAVMRGSDAVVQLLIEKRSAVASSPDGLNALHLAAIFGSSVDIVLSLVGAGTEIDRKFRPRCGSLLWIVYTALDLTYLFGGRGFKSLAGHHCWGATPLMIAVLCGNHGVAATLIEKGADSDLRNLHGRNASQLARIFGHIQAPE